jgi:hypothetical protein
MNLNAQQRHPAVAAAALLGDLPADCFHKLAGFGMLCKLLLPLL